jgi:hypothetical protein
VELPVLEVVQHATAGPPVGLGMPEVILLSLKYLRVHVAIPSTTHEQVAALRVPLPSNESPSNRKDLPDAEASAAASGIALVIKQRG